MGLCAKARREEVEDIRRHRMYTRFHQKGVPIVRRRRHPSRQDRRRLTRDNQGSATCAVGREGIQDAREARVVRVDAAVGGVESSAVRDRHG